VRGRVVYLEELDAERCAMGIEFTELGDQAAALLARYVDKAGGESGD
jgi:hypothetical protein